MQSGCIFTQEQNTRQVWRFPDTPMFRARVSAFSGKLPEPLRQRHASAQRTRHDENRIVPGDRAEHFRKLLLVNRFGDRLCTTGYRMENDELADPIDLGE